MWLLVKYIPNKLTLLYSKIYYKEENYLKVKTVVFKYITPPYSKGWVCWYISISVYFIFLCFHISTFRTLIICCLYDSAYPLSYGSTGSISSVSCALILTCLRSCLSICTILLIRSVTLLRFYSGCCRNYKWWDYRA